MTTPPLEKMIDESQIIDLKATTKDEAIKELVDVITTSDLIEDKEEFLRAIIEREKVISTGVGIGIALPHVKIPCVKDFVAAVGRSHKGIDFDSLDEHPVNLIVMIGASDRQSGEFLKILAKLMLKLKNKEIRKRIMLAKTPKDIKTILCSEEYQNSMN